MLLICVVIVLDYLIMLCFYYFDKVVLFCYLILDFLMVDLLFYFLLDESEFKFEVLEFYRIGGGGLGEVYCGLYRDEVVVIKMFYFFKVMK